MASMWEQHNEEHGKLPTGLSHGAAAMARRFVHTNLAGSSRATHNSRLHGAQEQLLQTGISQAWCVILFVVIPMLLLLFGVAMCLFAGEDQENADDPVARPSRSALINKIDSKRNMNPQSSSPMISRLLSSPFGPDGSQGIDVPGRMKSAGTLAQQGISAKTPTTASVPFEAVPAPQSEPPAASLLRFSPSPPASLPPVSTMPPQSSGFATLGAPVSSSSIWSGGGRTSASMPPQLFPGFAPAESRTAYTMPKASFTDLAARRVIEVLGAFDYPVACARLGHGPEGSRLELAIDPSMKDILVTVGPLSFPANLAQDAFIHGPGRELYGQFKRNSTGFVVGHYSQPGGIVMLTHKRTASGIRVDVASAAGQSVGALTVEGSTCKFEVGPGMDGYLVFASVLATVVASQSLIDDLNIAV